MDPCPCKTCEDAREKEALINYFNQQVNNLIQHERAVRSGGQIVGTRDRYEARIRQVQRQLGLDLLPYQKLADS